VPSEANFVLVLFEGALTATAAFDGISQAGYAVRHLPGQGLPQALRITIGTAAQMDDIAKTLRSMAEAAR
jgi:histidinol-phosphate aminotransferase